MVRLGTMVITNALSILVETPSGPAAICGFSFSTKLKAP